MSREERKFWLICQFFGWEQKWEMMLHKKSSFSIWVSIQVLQYTGLCSMCQLKPKMIYFYKSMLCLHGLQSNAHFIFFFAMPKQINWFIINTLLDFFVFNSFACLFMGQMLDECRQKNPVQKIFGNSNVVASMQLLMRF